MGKHLVVVTVAFLALLTPALVPGERVDTRIRGVDEGATTKHHDYTETVAGAELKASQNGQESLAIASDDASIKFPDQIPGYKKIEWSEPLPGFFAGNVSVLFHNRLVDRIQILRVDPERYKFGVHNDPQLRTIETWREDLDALAVINGSYYKAKPVYGAPLTPVLMDGKFAGVNGYRSKHGVFLAEPVDPTKPKATFVDFGGSVTKITEQFLKKFGYKEAVVSYPVLLDYKGSVRAKNNPKWRATRTFTGMDKNGYVILGNTQGGFFSLYRLGQFLKSLKELDLVYVLNMDGGPPACMDVKAGEFRYTNYGIWESNDASGREIIYWNDQNRSKWRIPNVISVCKR